MRGRSGWYHNPAKAGAGASAVLVALGIAVVGCAAGGQPTVLPHATCGTAVTHSLSEGTQVLSADKNALTCFTAAARRCASASLAITEMGTDTGTSYVLAVEPGGAGCQVTELSQPYSANFGGSQGTITTTRCRVANVTAAGVTLGCGNQDLLVPATVVRL